MTNMNLYVYRLLCRKEFVAQQPVLCNRGGYILGKRSILYFDKTPQEYIEILERLKPEGFDIWYWEGMNEQERMKKLSLADYFLVISFRITKEILEKAEKVRLVQRTGVGVNNVDIAAAEQLGVPVCNIPGGNGIAVAEHTMLLILALYRHLVELNAKTKNGDWPSFEYRSSSYEMEGKTHGFIGFGFIGRETAKRSKAFGTKIVYYDLFRANPEVEQQLGAEYLTMEEVLKQSDIVSIHIPLNPNTRNIIAMPQLKMMKKNAIIINTARGGLVNEKDLYEALTSKIIAGAGIDTWEDEPVKRITPLFSLDNVIATPHAAAGTIDTFCKCVKLSFDNIVKAELEGKPGNVKNNVRTPRFY